MWIQRDIEPLLLRRLSPEHVFVTLDLPSEAEQAETDPGTFLARHPPPVIIDEVQYAPELFRHLKTVVDRDRRPGAFLLTGSQATGPSTPVDTCSPPLPPTSNAALSGDAVDGMAIVCRTRNPYPLGDGVEALPLDAVATSKEWH